jgi:hypothetical protein
MLIHVLNVKMVFTLKMMLLLMYVFNKLKLKNVISTPLLFRIGVMFALMILLWSPKKKVALLLQMKLLIAGFIQMPPLVKFAWRVIT